RRDCEALNSETIRVSRGQRLHVCVQSGWALESRIGVDKKGSGEGRFLVEWPKAQGALHSVEACKEMEEPAEKGMEPRPPHGDSDHGNHSGFRRAISIQRTPADGACESSDDSDCVFIPDHHGNSPPPPRPCRAPASPATLGDRSASAPAFISPHPPSSPANLVKSISTEIGHKEPSSSSSPPSSSSCSSSPSLRPKPLLSLVKSLSTEISRREPEVAQSKSDSKLNLHLWKQLTQPKGAEPPETGAEPGSAPPSPTQPQNEPEARGASVAVSGGFFKAELEDTRRKLSEAMQEPLSMLSKIIGEDSPKQQQRAPGATDSPGGGAKAGGRTEDSDSEGAEKQGGWSWRSRCVSAPDPASTPSSPAPSSSALSRDSKYEICAHGDIIQVVEMAGSKPGGLGVGQSQRPAPGLIQGPRALTLRPSVPVSGRWLFCVSALAYGFFVLPLPSYLAGLALGLASGFMLGLLAVLLLAPRRSPTRPFSHRGPPSLEDSLRSNTPGWDHGSPKILQGWMNEIHTYDPESYHPSLTHSVYATLEGSCLTLGYPRTNVPRRAAFHDPTPDPAHEHAFIRHRYFQLASCKVFLLPAVLARKRVWNKKYPICLELEEEQQEEEEAGAGAGAGAGEGGGAEEVQEKREKERLGQPRTPVTLFLFGRTGREKEEWFQHFLSASKATGSD
ncbi:hypothetical protein JZ751_019960, partial [Albula glossodonta]